MAGSSIKKFLVTRSYAPGSFAIDWSIIPDSFMDCISKRLYNISAVQEDGGIIEKTVVFICPISDTFTDNIETVELFNGKVVIGKDKNDDEL